MLQDGTGQQSVGLEVSLQGINGVPLSGQDDSTGGSAILVAVIVLILMAADVVSILLLHQQTEAAGDRDRSM
jgi:hypothetical protein